MDYDLIGQASCTRNWFPGQYLLHMGVRVIHADMYDTFIMYTMFGSVGTPKACRVGSLSQSVNISVEDICYDL